MEKSASDLIGMIACLTFFAACYLLYSAIDLGAPASWWCVGSGIGLATASCFDGPWLKAAKAVLLPSTIAFALLTLALFWLNATPGGLEKLNETDHVAAVEYSVLALDAALPNWVKLSWWQSLALMSLLIAIAKYISHVRLISKIIVARKSANVAISTLAILSSFSFFTSNNILKDATSQALSHVTVLYNSSRERELKQLAIVMGSRATVTAFQEMSEADRHFWNYLILDSVAMTHAGTSFPHINNLLENDISQSFEFGIGKESIEWSDEDIKSLVAQHPVSLTSATAKSSLQKQVKEEDDLTVMADEERRKAIEEILGSTLGLAGDTVIDFGKEIVTHFLDCDSSLLLTQAINYLGEVSNAQFERLTEQPVAAAANKILNVLLSNGLDTDAKNRAQLSLYEHIKAIVYDRPKELIARAREELKSAADGGLRANDNVENASNYQRDVVSNLKELKAFIIIIPDDDYRQSLERYLTSVDEDAAKLNTEIVDERPKAAQSVQEALVDLEHSEADEKRRREALEREAGSREFR